MARKYQPTHQLSSLSVLQIQSTFPVQFSQLVKKKNKSEATLTSNDISDFDLMLDTATWRLAREQPFVMVSLTLRHKTDGRRRYSITLPGPHVNQDGIKYWISLAEVYLHHPELLPPVS